MAENKPGDGSSSPFGNGQGATSALGAAKGGNDFVTNPRGWAGSMNGRNFLKEASTLKQPSGSADTSASEPAGGKILKADATGVRDQNAVGARKPFVLKSVSASSGPVQTPPSPESGGGQLPWPPAGTVEGEE